MGNVPSVPRFSEVRTAEHERRARRTVRNRTCAIYASGNVDRAHDVGVRRFDAAQHRRLTNHGCCCHSGDHRSQNYMA